MNWYGPRYGAVEGDLDPSLTNEEGARDAHPTLELLVRFPTGQSAMDSTDWTGIVQEIDFVGVDLSGLQAVEVWINDFQHDHALTRGSLRLALGRFSEDAFWDPRNPPNYVLDREDKNLDGRLDRFDPSSPEYLAVDEDTGLDGLHDAEEPGYSGPGSDPNQDDYRFNFTQDDYSQINNLEGNAVADPNAVPDTEDLNRDGGLDLDEDGHEVTIDLADTAFVRIDVPRDYAAIPGVREDNGWRLFRVPADAFRAFGPADWDRVYAVRLMLADMRDSLRIQLGGIRLVGVPAPETGPRVALHQNRPNPFNPSTVIQYDLRHEENVRLSIFDVRGRIVARLVEGVQEAGPHRAVWSGRNDHGHPMPSGVYIYRLRTSGGEASRRMVLLK